MTNAYRDMPFDFEPREHRSRSDYAAASYSERIMRPAEPNFGISFLWEPGVRIAELIYEPGGKLRFAVRERGIVTIRDTLGNVPPLGWLQTYASAGALRLPSAVGPYESLDEIAELIRTFIHKYYDCDEQTESVLVLYILHTWVYNRFSAVPYLRFHGDTGTGKTRATDTVAALCYRAVTMAAATTAVLFRLLEAIGGTAVLDEADFQYSQIGSDIARILNLGYEKSHTISRMHKPADSGFYEPGLFDPFGPKIIAGRTEFADNATESRCLRHVPRPTDRPDIPLQLPPSFESEARAIRNKLLAWRLENLDTFECVGDTIRALRPRTNQIIQPLRSVARLLPPRYETDLVAYATALDSAIIEADRHTDEAILVTEYVGYLAENASSPTCQDLVVRIRRSATDWADQLDRNGVTPRSVSNKLRSLGFTTLKRTAAR